MARRGGGIADRTGWLDGCLLVGASSAPGHGSTLPSRVPEPQGVKHAVYGSEVCHRNSGTHAVCPVRNRASRGERRRAAWERSPRSSRSAGKPHTWRRGAEGGTTFMTEGLSVDSDNQADKAWLLGVQRKLYQWSKGTPEGAYGDVWNWVTDPRNLRCAWHSIAHNKGRRTPGVDGSTVASIAAGEGGVPLFLDGLRVACPRLVVQPGGGGFYRY